MSVLINKHTRVLVQGITGKNGTFHTEQAIAYGTQIVGGVTPGKGGQRHLDRPVFDSMKEAMRQTEADASVIYVPAPFVLDSVVEAIEAGVKLVVIMIGEIGGNAEERAAEFIRHEMNKPVVGYIAGVTAPKGKRMGHAGAIISGGSGSAEDKFRAFDKAGMAWTRNPALLGETLWNVIK